MNTILDNNILLMFFSYLNYLVYLVLHSRMIAVRDCVE